ncbi:DNRLRE domain-containing protein, partial [Fervidicella metallireducens]|uniref:DNRLRE domain-containing protein n=1 Tax=Fervidicella metallireducens TaxID=655338 RepID=UPI0012683199
MEDGSYEAQVYPTAVHFKENGKWKDIDNILQNGNDEGLDVIENKDNSYKIKIAKNTNPKRLIKITKDNYQISWNIDNPEKATAETIAPDNTYLDSLSYNEKKKVLTNLTSTVKFSNVYPNVDLQYNVNPQDVKEYIILNRKVDNSQFVFNINVNNLTPKLMEDKTIVFYDSNDLSKEVFKIDAPYMFDANNAESRDIDITLEKVGEVYKLTLTPNAEWINSSDRVYPIKIDPTVSTDLDRNDIYDVWVSEDTPTTCLNASKVLKVGTTTNKNRVYIRFALPTLTSSDMVIDAKLNLQNTVAAATASQINAFKVNAYWNPGTLTWNTQPTGTIATISDYQIVLDKSSYNWNITGIVKGWYSGQSNYGILLKQQNEANPYCEFFSGNVDDTISYRRPKITISYINNSGLEDYWTYHSQSVGRAGTSHINDYNGNLIFTHADISMNGNRMPISISHVFNSNEKDQNINYGYGWRLNLNQRIVPQTIGTTQYYIYTDEDGTKHYLKIGATQGVYEDESGINITMTIDSASTLERYKVKDKGGNQLSFTSTGYLYLIKDANGNTNTLQYSGSDLVKVTDSTGRYVTLERDPSTKYLTAIVDPAGRRTSFEYTNNRLTKITYSDGKYSTYNYDANGNITSVINFDE